MPHQGVISTSADSIHITNYYYYALFIYIIIEIDKIIKYISIL